MTRETLRAACVQSNVPPSLHEGLIEYIMDGRPTGGFLRAVLDNNLYRAVNYADVDNVRQLGPIVDFLTNYAPPACWLRPDYVDTWIRQRGYTGRRNLGATEPQS